MRKITFFIAFIFCFAGTANAQFLKNLGDKIERAAERAIERKVEEKVEEEIEEVLEEELNKEKSEEQGEEQNEVKTDTRTGMFGLSKAEPAVSYAFNHKAKMQIKNGKDVMNVDYFLPNSGNYLCAQIKDEKLKEDYFTVFDIEKEAMFTYMESDGRKMRMSIPFKTDEAIDETPIDIKATGNTKTILGYKCQEYKMTGEDMTGTIWVTKDVDIRFPTQFYKVKQNKSSNQEWMKYVDGWAMEMEMIDSSKRKPQTITMNCLSIEQSNLKINSKDYQGMGF